MQCRYAECRYAECRYGECRGSIIDLSIFFITSLPFLWPFNGAATFGRMTLNRGHILCRVRPFYK